MFPAALLRLVCTAETSGQARRTEPVWDASAMEGMSYSDHSAMYAQGRFLFRFIYVGGIIFCCVPYVAHPFRILCDNGACRCTGVVCEVSPQRRCYLLSMRVVSVDCLPRP